MTEAPAGRNALEFAFKSLHAEDSSRRAIARQIFEANSGEHISEVK